MVESMREVWCIDESVACSRQHMLEERKAYDIYMDIWRREAAGISLSPRPMPLILPGDAHRYIPWNENLSPMAYHSHRSHVCLHPEYKTQSLYLTRCYVV